ncbi:AraC family transcriptional regulator [Parendozoicomonas sp. Alg238-R29]|uniref:AraC family transcriptional regulator n=1 Tax=Parendozoicomonas sp. Alg238-R29 TaxID=2993446 RepID=UPI00248E7247|nr:AraC family transcriptional regulator [Parendozoicomonas sp. Alg238-R29]
MTTPVALITNLCKQQALEHSEDFARSSIEEIRFFLCRQHQQRTPKVYSKGVVITIQGYKEAYCAGQKLAYGPGQCLVAASNLPMECETFASPEKPLMGMCIDLDSKIISELSLLLKQHNGDDYFDGVVGNGIAVFDQDESFKHTVHSLLAVLSSPVEAVALGNHYYRELHYRLLTSPQRHLVATLCQQDHVLSRISQVTEFIQNHYEKKLTVEVLAQQAGMSISAFHRAFKQAVEDSPLQYLKKIRLTQAKRLMAHHGLAANSAAFEVGYESPAQFSREFKRYFGLPPSKAAQIGFQS